MLLFFVYAFNNPLIIKYKFLYKNSFCEIIVLIVLIVLNNFEGENMRTFKTERGSNFDKNQFNIRFLYILSLFEIPTK